MESPLISVPRASLKKEASIRIAGLGTAVPPLRVTQEEALRFVLASIPLTEAAQSLYKRTFGNKAIAYRHFGLNDLSEVLDMDLDHMTLRFQKWAVALSSNALNVALHRAGLSPVDLDYVAVATCTGYLCPGLSSYLIESCGLRSDIHAVDLVGMGCGAAPPALEQAFNFLSAHPSSSAAVVNAEICSAAMFFDESPDIVISNAIFADGASAMILTNQTPENGLNGHEDHRVLYPHIKGFSTLVIPEWRESLRFRRERGYLRNVLSKEVPSYAALGIQKNLANLLNNFELDQTDIKHWIVHPGGGRVLDAIQTTLNLPVEALQASRSVLKKFGNMSSATVVFVLEEEQKQNPPRPGDWGIICSFGAGFSVYAALVQYE